MKVKSYLFILLLIILIPGVSLFGKEGDKKIFNKIGFIFRFDSLTAPVGSYTDSIITGFGLKFWISEKLSFRTLLYLNFFDNTEAETSTTDLGAGVAVEYHFIEGKVSPYFGALGGLAAVMNEENVTDFYLGAILGAEVNFLPYLSAFAEYSICAIFRELGTEIDLASKYKPAIGIILYF